MSTDHRTLIQSLTAILSTSDWPRLPAVFAPDAVMEYPQSGEVFRGIDNIRGQFEDYPDMPQGAIAPVDVSAEEPTYALAPTYNVISVGGRGDLATATLRARYPDGSLWWVVVVYESDGERISHAKVYFAPDFEPAEWRARYTESPQRRSIVAEGG